MSHDHHHHETLRPRIHPGEPRRQWRSLDELADTPEFREMLAREFPENASEWADPIGRRQFLKLMGASLALAGLTSCTRQPQERIYPYTRAPDNLVPGRPLFFATAMPFPGGAMPVLAESHMGRPTKIEGNPEHPASGGATDVFSQASVLDLYDPDRSQVIIHLAEVSTWAALTAALTLEMEHQRVSQGAGLRILTEAILSPTLADQLAELIKAYPRARWHQYEPIGQDNAQAGTMLAFGEAVTCEHDLSKATRILSLDADVLGGGPAQVRCARQFAATRTLSADRREMSRLYVVEGTPTLTGAAADHRLPLRPDRIGGFARALAARLGVETTTPDAEQDEATRKFLAAVATDLEQAGRGALVLVGESQPPEVHALACAINARLGAVGHTVTYRAAVDTNVPGGPRPLAELADDLESGAVDLLIVLGGNPVYDAPADLDFARRFQKARQRVHLSSSINETSRLSHWHVPRAHYLESWSDTRAADGTVSLIQPLIAPLYSGRGDHELIAALLGDLDARSYDIVRAYWRRQNPWADFETGWEKSLHDGWIEGTQAKVRQVTLRSESLSGPASRPHPGGQGEFCLVFRPDASLFDGRFANNGWLQELPRPLTTLTWDNAALLSPADARKLGVANQDMVELSLNQRKIELPVWILPGQTEGCVTVALGYGRSQVGSVGANRGFDTYQLRTGDALWFANGLGVRKVGGTYRLACTQQHHSMEGRDPVRVATVEQFHRDHEIIAKKGEKPDRSLTLYPEYPENANEWGMTINLSACIGCNACTIACQAENNIPVVGKDQVLVGREMHWIRVDRYFEGDEDHLESTHHQPVPCMHCENAPCELVCPVAATVHSDEGLNDMVYNRCVGTRYCSNNCPYKVRRFNFLLYSDFTTPSLELLRNPDVTVRSRGVMEKCSYCVQRISAARIEAKKQDRPIRDGEVVTACQQVCPAQAIVFGNLSDPDSKVSKAKADPLNYGLLEELNVRPRTTYLARLRNPNPTLEGA